MIDAKNWYHNTRQFLQDTFGDNYKLFAGLLAATSPQTMVQVNWNLACKVYHQYKAGRTPNVSGLMKCHKPNVKRVLAGEQLSGRKVQNFYQNLIGNDNAVTIDTWMLRLFKWFDRGTKRVPTDRQYDKLANVFRKIAKQNGYKPAEFQAILWTWYRKQNGYKPVDFISVGIDKRQYTFEDLL